MSLFNVFGVENAKRLDRVANKLEEELAAEHKRAEKAQRIIERDEKKEKAQEMITNTQPDERAINQDALDQMRNKLTPYQRKMIGRATSQFNLLLNKRKSLHKLDLKHFMLDNVDA